MRFNPRARLDTSRVQDAGGGGGGGGLGGGGMRIPIPGGTKAGGGIGTLLIIILIVVLQQCSGGGSGLPGGSSGYSSQRFNGASAGSFANCQTGQDANDKPDTCGMVAVENSLVDYWKTALPAQDPQAQFQPEAGVVSFSGGVQTGCGQASSAMGPFYCPNDQTIYLDPTFFRDIFQKQLNGQDAPFVRAYVLAHEFGHHIQNLMGTMGKVRTQKGPNSDSVRLELQADCYAGMWAKNAQTTPDAQGNTLIQDLTQQDIQQAIDAAKTVGDDYIQNLTQGQVNPDGWTHGSSAARMKWFSTGYQQGSLQACDTFSVPTVE